LKRLLALIIAFLATGGQAQVEGTSLQFAHVTSTEIADTEVENGNLARVHLFPLELGGQDVPLNVIYIPIGMKDKWRKLIGTIEKFRTDGLIDKLKVVPEYNGASVVPCRIKFIGTHYTKWIGFEPVIAMWKCA